MLGNERVRCMGACNAVSGSSTLSETSRHAECHLEDRAGRGEDRGEGKEGYITEFLPSISLFRLLFSLDFHSD